MPYALSRLMMWAILAALPLNFLPSLPAKQTEAFLVLLSLGLFATGGKWAKEMAIVLMLFVWMVIPGRILLEQVDALTVSNINAEVQIAAVMKPTERLKVRIKRVDGKRVFPPIYALINHQHDPDKFCAGQRWNMRLSLRAVHARLNEGGFDAQRYAVASHAPLTGRVRTLEPLSTDCGLRDNIIAYSQQHYGEYKWHAILSALAFGERGDLSPEVNALLRETGTAHLMAISGMHIGLAAGVGWIIARAVQLLFPAHRISYRFPLFVSLLVALAYTWLSGGNPPAVRAMLALSVWTSLRLAGARCSGWQVWCLCVGLIIVVDPLSVLSASLWLSAIAVAGLLLWYHWFPLPSAFSTNKKWVLLQLAHLQLGMFLLMMPVQMIIFHGVSISALIANLWAVPLITFLTVPLILMAIFFSFCTPVTTALWALADHSIELVLVPLFALPEGWIAINERLLIISGLVWMAVVAWRFGHWKTSPFTLVSLCAAMIAWRSNSTEPNWRVDMLDVGHGLAMVISRNGEGVVYDTGNRWEKGDAALSQMIPWLKWKGIEVKHIILSHEHLDHIGGFASLHNAFPDAKVHSGLGWDGHLPCHKGIAWEWQGLALTMMWPEEGETKAGNDQSCVVRVSDGKWRLLLTGDIESRAEMKLVAHYREALRADILQVPHHGSGTSSVPAFLRAVSGSVALASAARYSAWNIPANSVIDRYHHYHYEWQDTAVNGQTSVEFYDNNWKVKGLRAQIMPRWYHQWFGVPRYSR